MIIKELKKIDEEHYTVLGIVAVGPTLKTITFYISISYKQKKLASIKPCPREDTVKRSLKLKQIIQQKLKVCISIFVLLL